MNDFNLFSEIYGCYFSVTERVIEQAKKGLSKKEIETIVRGKGFYDSAFYLLPKYFSESWHFIEQREDEKFYTKKGLDVFSRPLSHLEKSWIKSLLLDKRMRLFIDEDELTEMQLLLEDVSPLFLPDQIHTFDIAKDGDPYENPDYIKNFKCILQACIQKQPLMIEYFSGKRNNSIKKVFPEKIIYSAKDDKFRLQGWITKRNNRLAEITLNLGRIQRLSLSRIDVRLFDPSKRIKVEGKKKSVILSISNERNALMRCMLQFSSLEKETEFDEENDCYTCKIYYDESDETELLIRILSFGPVVKVLGPQNFLKQIKERIFNQCQLIENN